MTKLHLAKAHHQHEKRLSVLIFSGKLRQKYSLLELEDLQLSLVFLL